eukprot:6468300-Amphidinium_carterae.4
MDVWLACTDTIDENEGAWLDERELEVLTCICENSSEEAEFVVALVASPVPNASRHDIDELAITPLPDDDTEVATAPLLQGASLLVKHFHSHVGKFKLESDWLTSKHTLRRIVAAAEQTIQQENQSLESILGLVQRMVDADCWQAVAFLHHIAYDETTQDIVMQFQGDECADRQVAKVYVIEQNWSMVLRRRPGHRAFEATAVSDAEYFELQGAWSPTLRGSSSGTGETIQTVLLSCPQCPSGVSLFPMLFRLCETDEDGANARAEQLMLKELNGVDAASSWNHCYILCLGHKAHAIAQKTWTLQGSALSGLIHSCKTLSLGGAISRLKDAAKALVSERLAWRRHESLTEAGTRFRDRARTLISVESTQPRRKALIELIFKFFNGDWRQGHVLVHTCDRSVCGVCQDHDAAVRKAQWLITRLVSSLAPRMFSRDNWQSWPEPLAFYQMGAYMHGFLHDAFVRAFGKVSAQSSSNIQESDLDAVLETLASAPAVDTSNSPDAIDVSTMMRMQMENAKSARIAVDFMKSPTTTRELHLLRSCLLPQQQLMNHVLQTVGVQWEKNQLLNLHHAGHRDFRIALMANTSVLKTFFSQTWELLVHPTWWEDCLETETFRSQLARLLLRSGAVCYKLIHLRATHCPYKIFLLVSSPENMHAVADSILDTPLCLRDRFSKAFLARYNTREKLLSPECLSILFVIAQKIQLTTYSSERLHSKNLRRARSRVETNRIPLAQLALAHVGISESAAQCSSSSQQSKPRGRPRKDKHESKQRGGGGAWRAYLHYHMTGQKASGSSWQDASTSYHSLDSTEFAFFRELGHAGLSHSASKMIRTDSKAKCTSYSLASSITILENDC